MGQLQKQDSTASDRRFKPKNLMDSMLVAWHSGIGPELEVEYADAIRRFTARLPGGVMNRWSLFAGCGVASHFLSALRAYFHAVYEVDMVPDTVLLCEHNPDKQLHLIE